MKRIIVLLTRQFRVKGLSFGFRSRPFNFAWNLLQLASVVLFLWALARPQASASSPIPVPAHPQPAAPVPDFAFTYRA